MSKIDFQIKGIGTLIKENEFVVPDFQRSYQWKDEHIETLLSDITEAISKNESEYFLGTIVLSEQESSKVLEIIDGQQRISTIMILLASIRDYYLKNKEDKSANSIQSDFISSYNRSEKTNNPKLILSKQDKSFFQDLIVDGKDSKPSKDSHKRIELAKQKTIKKVNSVGGLSISEIHKWENFIIDDLKVVSITVPNNSNAYTLFETLNDRGLVLAQTDLLKNYLFSRAGRYLDDALYNWQEMATKLETAKNEELILTYIRHSWSSRYGLTREANKELYKSITASKKSETDIRNFIQGLNEEALVYLAVLDSKNPYWDEKNHTNNTKKYIEILNFLGLEQFKPLVFSIIKKFENNIEIEKSLKLIVSWVVRNQITGSLGGGPLEKEYVENAKRIFNGDIKTANELRSSIKVIPSDEEFKTKLSTISLSKEYLARYYLRAIEEFGRGGKNPELVVNEDPQSVDLEHILPKKLDIQKWPNITEEEHDNYYKKLGNLTVMSKKLNNSQKNESFINKIEYYRQSDIKITKELSELSEWNIDKINERQKKFAEIAVKVWSIKFE